MKNQTINLGIIHLSPASTTLGDVEIKGEERHVEYKLDKKVVNVTKDLMASSGSAIQVLENVPSVDVDLEGRFTDEEQVDNTFLYVEIFNEQKAEKILKDYFDSRDKK